jgi:DnaJ family protein C protein 28
MADSIDAQPQPLPKEPDATPPPRRLPGQSWSSLIDEQIHAAQRAGAFDNLAVAGKPLELDENPYAKDRRLEFSILKSHGMAPREIALGSEADENMAKAERLLDELRHRRDVIQRRHFVTARDRRAYNIYLKKIAAQYETLLQAVRSKILSLNIIAPASLHRPPLDVEAYMRQFREQFQPVPEH